MAESLTWDEFDRSQRAASPPTSPASASAMAESFTWDEFDQSQPGRERPYLAGQRVRHG
ncbi:MAG: hypothetical protein AAFX10_01940 [Pseudomonadota bacterium]